LQFNQPIKSRTIDIEFWKDVTLAAEMWLASADAMVRWKSEHPASVLMFNQHGFVREQEALKNAAVVLNFHEHIFDCLGFNSSFMQQSISESLLAMIPPEVQQRCDEKQQELVATSDIFSPETVVVRASDEIASRVWKSIPKAKGRTTTSSPVSEKNVIMFDGLTLDDSLALLNVLPKKADNVIDWSALLNRQNLTSTAYDNLYLMSAKHGALDIAEIAIRRALSISKYHYRYTHLGDIFVRRKMPLEAKVYFEKASEMVVDNSAPIAKLAEAEAMAGNIEQAEALLNKAKKIDDTKPAIRQAEIRLSQARKAAQKQALLTAKDDNISSRELNRSDSVMQTISDYSVVVDSMEKDIQEGRLLDELMVRTAFLMRNNFQWLKDGSDGLSEQQTICLLDYIITHYKNLWSGAVIETELLGSAIAQVDLKVADSSKSDNDIKLGVVIHVFYPELLDEIFSILNELPYVDKLVLTCTSKFIAKTKSRVKNQNFVEVVEVENKGRDILPWLDVADRFNDFDAVLKLHTKSTPHEPELAGWRLQLLWQLSGKENLTHILKQFAEESALGMVIPKYHPFIAPHINWGQNLENAKMLAERLSIELPDDIKKFPAGSMFWYRPSALRRLFESGLSEHDFPSEEGQIDGSIMHAIERVLCLCVEQDSFYVRYVK
jgi:hypothetical protein